MKKPSWPFVLNAGCQQAQGLVGYWPGVRGNRLMDMSGNANHMNLTGLTWSPGNGGGSSLTFAGHLSVADPGANPAKLKVANGQTIMCWINTVGTGYQYMMTKWGTGASSADSWHLRLDTVTGYVYYATSTDGVYDGAGRDLNGTTAVNDGKWHHVAATYDLVKERVYVDGLLQASLAATGALFDCYNDVALGALGDGNSSANNFVGRMEDFRIYNRALTAPEIYSAWAPSSRWQLRYQPSFSRHILGALSAGLLLGRRRRMA